MCEPGTQFCCFASVEQKTYGVIERFGKFMRFAEPGCHFLCCPCGESLRDTLSMRVIEAPVRVETKTSDDVFLQVVVSVQYQVIQDKMYEAYYSLTDSEAQIRSYVYDVVRSSIPKLKLDEVFMKKDDIALDIKKELREAMDDYGYNIVQALLTDIDPDIKVKNAMNEINAAQRNMMAAEHKANASKILVVKEAEAEADARYLQGMGIARQREAIVDGLRRSVAAYTENIPGTEAGTVMDMMLMTQYFDTLKDIGAHSGSNTIFVPSEPGGAASVASQIRMGVLSANSAMNR